MTLARYFNIFFLNFEKKSRKVQRLTNLIFCYNMIPLPNKPARVAKNTANAIDHIIANTVIVQNN